MRHYYVVEKDGEYFIVGRNKVPANYVAMAPKYEGEYVKDIELVDVISEDGKYKAEFSAEKKSYVDDRERMARQKEQDDLHVMRDSLRDMKNIRHRASNFDELADQMQIIKRFLYNHIKDLKE